MTDQINNWLSDTLQTEGLEEYEIRKTGNTGKSDGYLGIVLFVTVNGVTKNRQPKRLDLVLKLSKDNAYLREKSPMVNAFLQEMLIYEKVLPTFDAFQREKNVVDLFKSYPKCYKCLRLQQKEVIVLQNLKAVGYELHDRKKPMNFNHARTVLREYGKLHAISFAMRDQREKTYNALADGCKDLFLQFLEDPKSRDAFNGEFKRVLGILKEFGEHELYEKFKQYETCAANTFIDTCSVKEPQSSFVHGDSWNNNFMFKYKGTDKSEPSAMSILDWQASVVRSPVYDLSYFLYSTCSTVLDRFEELLHAYHDSFSNFVQQLGSSPELFTFEDLQTHWRKYSILGVTFLPFLLKLVLIDEKDAPDFGDLNEGQDVGELMNVVPLSDKKQYFERVKAACAHHAKTCTI